MGGTLGAGGINRPFRLRGEAPVGTSDSTQIMLEGTPGVKGPDQREQDGGQRRLRGYRAAGRARERFQRPKLAQRRVGRRCPKLGEYPARRVVGKGGAERSAEPRVTHNSPGDVLRRGGRRRGRFLPRQPQSEHQEHLSAAGAEPGGGAQHPPALRGARPCDGLRRAPRRIRAPAPGCGRRRGGEEEEEGTRKERRGAPLRSALLRRRWRGGGSAPPHRGGRLWELRSALLRAAGEASPPGAPSHRPASAARGAAKLLRAMARSRERLGSCCCREPPRLQRRCHAPLCGRPAEEEEAEEEEEEEEGMLIREEVSGLRRGARAGKAVWPRSGPAQSPPVLESVSG